MPYDNNILMKLIAKIPASKEQPYCNDELEKILNLVDDVYSYLVYAEYCDDKLSGWQVEFLVSQTKRFNTISKDVAINNVSKIILDGWKTSQVKYVIGYKQPPIDTLLEIFEPLIKKIVNLQQRHWKELEYEDLYQMCCLVICTLYSKGYYIHKQLIIKSYMNYVLNAIKKDRYKPSMISLDEPLTTNDEGQPITALDLVADPIAETKLDEMEEEEYNIQLINQKRDLIIDFIGQRQYDQLLREYGNGLTTNSGRKQVYRIRNYLAELGITDASFNKL